MEETDENGDGKLDFEEFKNAVRLALKKTQELQEEGIEAQ
jgi:hypothetical protein